MFKGIILFLLLITIILFPIPLKITLKYSNKVLEIYIYNKKLKTKTPSKSKLKSKPKDVFFKSFTLNDIKLIIYKIQHFESNKKNYSWWLFTLVLRQILCWKIYFPNDPYKFIRYKYG